MDNNIIILIIALLFSAFFSAVETVFITFDKLKLIVWRKQNDVFNRALRVFFPRQERFIITSLIGVNIAYVTFSSVAAIYLITMDLPVWLVIVISTLIILTFGEILPKAAALSLGNLLIRPFALILWLFYLLFLPVIVLLSSVFKSLLTSSKTGYQPILTRETLMRLMVSETGGLPMKEAEIVDGVLSFADKKMREIMTPRTDLTAASIDSNLNEILKLIIDSGHSKIAIYHKDIENIVGYIHALDLLQKADTAAEIVRPAVFVSEFTPVIDALKILKDKNVGMLMVVDEYGGLDGIATIEDVMEELFGKIEDEFDKPRFRYQKLSKGGYLISGRAEIDDLNRIFDFGLEKTERVETFGGWLITNLGRIPKNGEIFNLQGFRIEVMQADEVRIKIIKLKRI
ncbi:MAG: HlyC/CorC family transporter [candidate division Zixibacteria bacterium]|nr:HlyC/CorC family transporter [Candidatus Tariuqbacter arcticus]